MEETRNNSLLSLLLLWISSVIFIVLSTKPSLTNLITSALLCVLLGLALLFLYIKKLLPSIPKNRNIPVFCFFLSTLLAFLSSAQFYASWIKSENLTSFCSMFNFNSKNLLLTISTVGGFLSLYSLLVFSKMVFVDFLSLNSSYLKQHSFLCKTTAVMSLVYLFSILSILRANYLYKDDLARAAIGQGNFGVAWGRIISDYLSAFVHGSTYLMDVSPLTQLMSVVVIGFAAALLFFIITGQQSLSFTSIFALVPIGISPYFLECISYKYDCIYMSLSILFSVLPFLFENHSKKTFAFFSFLCAILTCTTYQSSMAIFPSVVTVLCFVRWIKNIKSNRQILRFVITSITSYAAGLLFFYLFIMKHSAEYYGVSSSLVSSNIFRSIVSNYIKYFESIFYEFPLYWLLLISVFFICFICSSIKKSQRKVSLTLLGSIACVVILLALSFSFFPLLNSPLIAARTKYGFCINICLIGLVSVCIFDNKLSKGLIFLLSCLFIQFSFTYGNALYAQKEYTSFRTELVIQDINETIQPDCSEQISLQIKGGTGLSPIIKEDSVQYPLLHSLLSTSLDEGSPTWGACGLYNYYDLNVYYDYDNTIDMTNMNLPVIKDTYYHTIQGDRTHLLITIKDPKK